MTAPNSVWPTTVNISPFEVFTKWSDANQLVGTISAVFGWHGSGQAPDKLSALITSSAQVSTYDPMRTGVPIGPDPDDGFQDPPRPILSMSVSGGYHVDSKVSDGTHLVQISNPSHSTTVKTNAYSLSAICGPSTPTVSYVYIGFLASVGNGVGVQAWSTHCAPALGGSDPNFDATNPQYFSGTGCQATGNAVALSGNVSHAQLCIGENGSDTVVKEYFASTTSGVPGSASVPLSVLFDSTHFKDQAKIKVKLKVWDTNGGNYDTSVTAPAYNKAYVMENNTALTITGDPLLLWGGIIGRVKRDLEPINYNTDLSSFLDGENATSKDVSNKITKATVFYADTHSNDNGFGDCFNAGDLGGTGLPGTTGGLQYSDLPPIIAKKYTSYGPYSTPSVPPYNLVFIDGCHSAGQFGSKGDNSTSGGAGSFGIYAPGNDRAFLGWTNFVSLWPLPLNDGTGFTAKLFDHLAENHDLYTACTLSMTDSPRIGWLGDDPNGVDKFNTGPLSPHIVGDPRMKLHGVYGDVITGYVIHPNGTESPAYDCSAWFRAL